MIYDEPKIGDDIYDATEGFTSIVADALARNEDIQDLR